MSTPKEAVYDEKISPLMSQIIAVCKEHKIAALCDFALGYDEDAGSELKCTTALLPDDHEPPRGMLDAYECVRPNRPSFTAIAITSSK